MLNKYIAIFFSLICFIGPVDRLIAADTALDFDSILAGAHKELLDQKGAPSPSSTEVIAKAADFVFWNASWDDVNASCEKSFSFNGHNLAIKLGFVRGAFDSYSQTYKAEPIIALRNVDANLVFPFIRLGQRVDNAWNTASLPGRVFVEFQAQNVIITDYYDSAKTLSIPYTELLQKWEAHASASCSWHLGKKYCLVAQTFWDGAYHQSGFVLTEGAPLFPATRRPQDYVSLFREEPTTSVPSYRQIVYSLALRVAFVLSPNLKNTWEMRSMTAAEIGEAMVDRMSMTIPPVRTAPTLAPIEKISR